ncbi:hypothetical protein [Rugamonas apoptosis]|uniref:hypothetical protein n=1 Tax=Rugamonas apoptosis TaxID=2758570 RepID=UPI0035CCF17D
MLIFFYCKLGLNTLVVGVVAGAQFVAALLTRAWAGALAKVALVCVRIEVGGQLCIWQAGAPALVYLGAALTGFGYSLAVPGFGVEAVKRPPPQSRGAAMGTYVAFLDLSLGITSPRAGATGGLRPPPGLHQGKVEPVVAVVRR